MTAALILLAVGGFGFAATAVALAIRQAKLREDLISIKSERERFKSLASGAADELHERTKMHERQVAVLRERLNELRGMIHALPDSAANRGAVLSELDRLLQGETGEDDRRHEDGEKLFGEPDAAAGDNDRTRALRR